MKKIMTITAIAMMGLIAVSGCKKKDDSPSYKLSATVGGTAFNPTNCTGTVTGGALSIVGWNGSGGTATPPYFSITVSSYTGAATYTIDTTLSAPVVSASYFPSASLTDVKFAKTGSVTVSSASSSTITGTFNFKCNDGTIISGGTFTAKKM